MASSCLEIRPRSRLCEEVSLLGHSRDLAGRIFAFDGFLLKSLHIPGEMAWHAQR